MLPLVEAGSGGLLRMWRLFPVGAVLPYGFARREGRVAARGLEPLVQPRLMREIRGYAAGTAPATVHFVGFSGI